MFLRNAPGASFAFFFFLELSKSGSYTRKYIGNTDPNVDGELLSSFSTSSAATEQHEQQQHNHRSWGWQRARSQGLRRVNALARDFSTWLRQRASLPQYEREFELEILKMLSVEFLVVMLRMFHVNFQINVIFKQSI